MSADGEDGSAWLRRVVAAFRSDPADGLLALAAERPPEPPPPDFAFWREFACRYLERLCRTPEDAGARPEPVEFPADSAALLQSAPPMDGGEYLTDDALRTLWTRLDDWVRADVAASDGGLAGWLRRRAPMWHQVGRVCFHLAENKRDPDFPFAFLATYAPRVSRAGAVQYQPLGSALKEYAKEGEERTLVRLLSPIHRASEQSGWVRELVESGRIYQALAWKPPEAYRLLKEAPVLESSGLLLRVPDWWQRRPRPRVAVTIGDSRQATLGAESMLDFKAELALGSETLSDAEWRALLKVGDGLVRLKGQWVELDSARLAETLAHWKAVQRAAGRDGVTFLEGMRLLAGAPADLTSENGDASRVREWSRVDAGTWLSGVLSRLRDPSLLQDASHGTDFRGTLRPYQQVGAQWLRFVTRLGLGACLADDMGLGKTIQILSLLATLKAEARPPRRPSLLVLPASLLANWKSEISRFTPSLAVRCVHPSEPEEAAAAGGLRDADLVITTYGMLARRSDLQEVQWRLVILDEAQAIKNPAARQTKEVKRLRADARLALTGTPVENRLSDLWSIFDFLSPGLLGSATRFREFATSLEERDGDRFAPLRRLVRPYILRRLKTDKSVIADLPDKTEVKAFCGLSRLQAALYARAVEELRAALDGVDGMKRRGIVLASLMRFKQICNHPSQLLGDGAFDPAASGKFERLKALGEEIASRQEKALVFTQFREMTGPIAAHLAEVFGREGAVLHGGTPVAKRKAAVDAFQRDDGPPFFVLSLKAGGTGLNLTAASHVVHFDRWWNPAVENQATDRAYRIGQRRNVLVHKFVCRGTVEERIDALIEEKSRLAGDILSGGAEVLLTELGDKDLLDLVALDIHKAGI